MQYSSLVDNPFAVLTLIAAPAILTSASSVLTLGTGNRFARVIDRSKELSAELRTLAADSEIYELKLNQFRRLQPRAFLLLSAMRCFYFAIGGFASSALVSLLGATLAKSDQHRTFMAASGLALVVGAAAVIFLVFGCVRMIQETRLGVLNLTEELEIFTRTGILRSRGR
jgi:hypothetical protein